MYNLFMEKRINNILFVNTTDGKRLTYNVLFTHHDNITDKDYAVFVNQDDDDNIILFSYDENITFTEVTNDEEISMMTDLLRQYDEQMCDIIYEGDELMLSKFNKYMYEEIHLNSLDEDNRRFVPDEVFETIEDAKKVVDSLIEAYESEYGPFVYAVIRKCDLKNIGYVQLVYRDDFYEIGYHIAKQYTSLGYATKALSLFLKCLQEKTNAKELFGITLKENIASQKVLLKCGFKMIYEGLGIYQGKQKEIVKTVIDLSKDKITLNK